ncbi:hypothetical protein CIW54_22780 [Paraburkholderia sp. T12-10]|nr:hypothetical protein CIW54_22780 [Paraburkholderia sp. T12-10]
MQYGIQLQKDHIRSDQLGPWARTIGFVIVNDRAGIYEATINETQLELIEDALATLPHKFDDSGEGLNWQARNGAAW